MEDYMTNQQQNQILEMIKIILEGCQTIEEALEKIRRIQETE